MTSGDPEASHIAAALRAFQAGEDRLAVSHARRYLALAPDEPNGLHLLGLIRFRLGDPAGSAQAIAAALAGAPPVAIAWTNLAIALNALANPGAAAVARRALALEPAMPDAWLALAGALDHAADFVGVAAAYRCTITLDPDRYGALVNLALIDEAVAGDLLGRAIRVAPQRPAAWRNLADREADSRSAATLLRRALSLAPADPGHWTSYGACLARGGAKTGARAAFRMALSLDPAAADARHLLDGLNGATPPAPPSGYVAGLFDSAAGRYDALMQGPLSYRTPLALRRLLDGTVPDASIDLGVDLGAGTGLMGRALTGRVARLHGVDLSAAMLRVAAATGLYDQLHQGDAEHYLRGLSEPPDLIVAADILPYIGDLGPLLMAVARFPDVLFLGSAERAEEPGWSLATSGRYQHHPAEIMRLLESAGLECLATVETALREEAGVPVPGLLFLARAD